MIKKTLCFSNPAFLSLKNKQMEIRFPSSEKDRSKYPIYDESIRTIPIEDIGVVILENRQIIITNALLDALTEVNAAVITCNSAHMPVSLLLPLSGNSIQSERFRAQIEASLPLRKQLWQQTIQNKIRNQAGILAHYTNQETRNMLVWANNVKSGDSENLEARAAVYYWQNLFDNITDFVRGQDDVPPNNLLNYGYAILRAVVARALVSSGLLPTLGIHHHNRYNAYCLADDIMEPYRPYVDEVVLRIIKERDSYEELTPELKRELLQIPTLDVMINNQRSPLMIAVTTTTASLAKCYTGELRKIIYPEILL